MANRRYEMYEYRQVIVRMRLGESDRAIARAGLMGRNKIKSVRELASKQGWLDLDNDLPNDASWQPDFPPQLLALRQHPSLNRMLTRWRSGGITEYAPPFIRHWAANMDLRVATHPCAGFFRESKPLIPR